VLKRFPSLNVATFALLPLIFLVACGDSKPATASPLTAMVGHYMEDIGDDDGAYHELIINADMTGVIGGDGSDNECHYVERDGQLIVVVDKTDEYTDFRVGDYALTIVDANTVQVEGPYGPITFRRSER
jgi:hypothetical protein